MSETRHSRSEPEELSDLLPEESALHEELVRAMRRLSRVPRTEAETRDYLQQRELPEESVEQIIGILKGEGFVNDARLAESYVRFRLRRGYGHGRIRRELREKGVAEVTIERALEASREDFRESEVLRGVIGKHLRVKGEPRTARDLKNLGSFLTRRGFDHDLIREELEVYFDQINSGGGKS